MPPLLLLTNDGAYAIITLYERDEQNRWNEQPANRQMEIKRV